MAPKEKKTKKKDDKMTPKDPITKDQKAVAKWLRRNVPTKNTKFMHSHKVDYFTGQVAVDKLLEESPWAKKNVKDPENQLYFEFRDECVDFLDELLKQKMFHRAKKITVDDKFLKSKKKKSKETEETDGDAGTKSDAATAKGTYSHSSINRTWFIKRSGIENLKKSLLNIPYDHKTACRKHLNVLLYSTTWFEFYQNLFTYIHT